MHDHLGRLLFRNVHEAFEDRLFGVRDRKLAVAIDVVVHIFEKHFNRVRSDGDKINISKLTVFSASAVRARWRGTMLVLQTLGNIAGTTE